MLALLLKPTQGNEYKARCGLCKTFFKLDMMGIRAVKIQATNAWLPVVYYY